MTHPPELTCELYAALRAFLAGSGRGRTAMPVLHLGQPGGEQRRIPHAPWHDPGARADLVTRALDGLACPTPRVWLARGGPTATAPIDLAWLTAARVGHGRHGRALEHFFVVTRRGWADVVTEEEHPWEAVFDGTAHDGTGQVWTGSLPCIRSR